MSHYRLYIEQKNTEYTYYQEKIVLEFDSVVAATKIIESVLASADRSVDTQCRLEVVRGKEDESIQVIEG